MLARRTPIKRSGTLKRSPLRRVSTKRAAQLREYTKARAEYLAENPICEVWLKENGWEKVRSSKPGEVFYSNPWCNFLYRAEEMLTMLHAPAATEVHHRNKRRGAMLIDKRYFLAVSRENHERIENNKAWARANGFLLNF